MATLTTLIPAYKKEYLGELFLGLQRQTFRDFRVVVSDDSPGEEITAMIHGGSFGALTRNLEIECLRGPKNARLNHAALLEHWAGRSPFVHIHLDDDVIFPDFYRQHMEAHAGGRYSVSVSRRWVTQDDIRPWYGIELPKCVAESPLRVVPVNQAQLFEAMVPTCNNWVGEFTNMVMSAEGARCWPHPPSQGLSYYGWMDVGFLLTAIQTQPMAYIRDHLSVFRQHAEQTTHRLRHHGGRVASMAWVTTALQAWHEKRISYAQAVHAISYTVQQCLKNFGEDDPVINRFYDLIQHQGRSLEQLHAAYTPFWLAVLASDPSTAPRTPARVAEPALA